MTHCVIFFILDFYYESFSTHLDIILNEKAFYKKELLMDLSIC